MQLNAYAEKSAPVALDVNKINFKSSPNFKNMKKFLKKRTGTVADGIASMDSPDSTPQQEEVQPPLPLEPPPPDDIPIIKKDSSPIENFHDEPLLLTTPKQECPSSDEVVTKYEESPEYIVEKPKVNPANIDPICKDFIRGTCSRVGCKYRHEVDTSQLQGIFIFCHNYQNSKKCLKPDCKYVHADVFEEREFYRSGKLPKVLLQKNQAPPPPPPLPPVTEEEPNKEVANSFVVTAPNCAPAFVSKQDQILTGLFNNNLAADQKSPRSSLKRTWSDSEDSLLDLFSCTSPPDESRAKRMSDGRCGSCKVMENRLKFALDRLRDIRKSAESSEKKMMQLEKKHKFLLQLASTITSARLNERENSNVGQTSTSIFSQIDLQQSLQSSAVAEHLSQFKKISMLQGTNLSAQLKNIIQTPIYNKIINIDENNSKVFKMQQLRQLLKV